MVSSQERIFLGFLENGGNLRNMGSKEGFGSDKRVGQAGWHRMASPQCAKCSYSKDQ